VKQRITDLLEDVSPDAQKVGRILIGEHVEGATPDLQEFASELKTRADKNRKYVQGRIQAAKSGAKTVRRDQVEIVA
jgi:hypothetical protein